MSITDELRWYLLCNPLAHYADFSAIADRIDSALADGYVELPKDANGEYVHIGDVMDNTHKRGFAAKTVIGISYHEGGKMCVRVDEDELRWHDPLKLRHHNAPTVEDVLREFAFQIGQSATDDDIVAEYAAKLRLKEDE